MCFLAFKNHSPQGWRMNFTYLSFDCYLLFRNLLFQSIQFQFCFTQKVLRYADISSLWNFLLLARPRWRWWCLIPFLIRSVSMVLQRKCRDAETNVSYSSDELGCYFCWWFIIPTVALLLVNIGGSRQFNEKYQCILMFLSAVAVCDPSRWHSPS